ncbi:MAG TPA: lamin tail domain-containing protein, partial [Bacteroidia bacterium]|nr:lamin tail domain-containing protein [Bacteroidia bacterium]
MKHIVFVLFSFLFIPAQAQVSESFSDGDFTNTPSWSGDNSEYVVNTSFQLQLNGVAADTSYLSFPSPFISNAEWQFWARLNFSPSDNNNARFYLVADISNLKGMVNGYYIRLGENGAFDSVDLWEQSGNSHTKIIDGVNAHCAASNNVLRVKVTRDATGIWNLFSDTLGGVNFQPEGNTFDNTHTTCNYSGVFSKYTVSNINRFYFDDIYAGPVIIDTAPPAVISATATSATTLDVLFDENVDLGTAQNISNYSVNNGIGNPAGAVRDGANNSMVHLTFSGNFISAQSYVLTVTNIADLNSNVLASGNANFSWYAIGTALFQDVIINEILADQSPVVGLPNAEFIELYNRSVSNFDLNGWAFSDGSSTAAIPAHILPAGGYVIICASADATLFASFGAVLGLASFPSLNNAGDNLLLTDISSTVIDSVSYTNAWYQDASKDDGGWTLELINPNAGTGCAVAGNWIASNNANGGTPGTQNSVFNNSPDMTGPVVVYAYASDSMHVELCFNESIDPAQLSNLNNYNILPFIGMPVSVIYDTTTLLCATLTFALPFGDNNSYTLTFSNLTDCAGNPPNPTGVVFDYHILQPYDVVVNEILADPDPSAGLPAQEYLELFNNTSSLLRLDNWTLTIGAVTQILPAVVLPADSFVLLTTSAGASLFPGQNVVGISGFPSLSNTGASISLRTQTGLLVHAISYTDSWYNDDLKSEGGWSLEQVDPQNPCGGSSNWRASVATAGGTPGYQNSVLALNPDLSAPVLERATVISADSIRLFFSESLDSLQLANVFSYAIDNGIGAPLSARPLSPDFTKVDLKLPAAIQSGIIYTVSVSSAISDCAGNNITQASTAPFALPEPVAEGDLVINEILFDPKDGGVDFVEIYNNSSKVIDLRSVYLCSQDTIANTLTELNVISPEGFLVFPSQYLVLSKNGIILQQFHPSADPERLLDLSTIPAMNVDGDIVILADTGLTIIDRLVYSSEWHFPLLQETKGISLERIDFSHLTQDYTNWHSASETVGSATPTKQNSQYNPGNADDGAVSVTQQIFSPDGDGYNDVVNISYNFTQPGFVANVTIYDARGRLVRTLIRSELLGTESGAFSWDGTMDDRSLARVGAYIIYFEV